MHNCQFKKDQLLCFSALKFKKFSLYTVLCCITTYSNINYLMLTGFFIIIITPYNYHNSHRRMRKVSKVITSGDDLRPEVELLPLSDVSKPWPDHDNFNKALLLVYWVDA